MEERHRGFARKAFEGVALMARAAVRRRRNLREGLSTCKSTATLMVTYMMEAGNVCGEEGGAERRGDARTRTRDSYNFLASEGLDQLGIGLARAHVTWHQTPPSTLRLPTLDRELYTYLAWWRETDLELLRFSPSARE